MDPICKPMKLRLLVIFVILFFCYCFYSTQFTAVTSSNPIGTWESRRGRFLFLCPDSSLYVADLPDSYVLGSLDWNEKGSWKLERLRDGSLDLVLNYRKRNRLGKKLF